MRYIFTLLSVLLLYSCVPLQVAPQIKNYKIKKGKHFKRKLPKQQAYIFEDPHGANSFYYFFNSSYRQDNVDVAHNIPITIDHRTYYLSFFEAVKKTKVLNLLPAMLSKDGESEIEKIEKWYIALMVRDAYFNDALKKGYRERDEIISYLNKLKKGYVDHITYDNSLTKD